MTEITTALCASFWLSALSCGGFLGTVTTVIAGVMRVSVGFAYSNIGVMAMNGVFATFVFWYVVKDITSRNSTLLGEVNSLEKLPLLQSQLSPQYQPYLATDKYIRPPENPFPRV